MFIFAPRRRALYALPLKLQHETSLLARTKVRDREDGADQHARHVRYPAFWKNPFSKVGWNAPRSVSPIRNCGVISNWVAQWISTSILPHFASAARTVSTASAGVLQSRLRCPSTTRS